MDVNPSQNLVQRAVGIIEDIKGSLKPTEIDCSVIKRMQILNGELLLCASLLELVLVENRGEHPVFEYMRAVEASDNVILTAKQKSYMQGMLLENLHSPFDIVKVWLPKLFYSIPAFYASGRIIDDEFLRVLVSSMNNEQFLTFIRISTTNLESCKHKVTRFLKIVVDWSIQQGFDAVAKIVFEGFSEQPYLKTILREELLLCFSAIIPVLAYLCTNEPRFIPYLFLNEAPTVEVTLDNVILLRDILLDLDIQSTDIPKPGLSSDPKCWYTVQQKGLFHHILDALKSTSDMGEKRTLYDILTLIVETSDGKITALWDQQISMFIPPLGGRRNEDSFEYEFVSKVYSLLKRRCIIAGVGYNF